MMDGCRSEDMNDRKQRIICDENLNILTLTWATSSTSTSTWALVAAEAKAMMMTRLRLRLRWSFILSLASCLFYCALHIMGGMFEYCGNASWFRFGLQCVLHEVTRSKDLTYHPLPRTRVEAAAGRR